jgi:hypothetical protein
MDDALPWATPVLRTAQTIYRDVDLGGGTNAGYVYCYWRFAGGGIFTEEHIPGYFDRSFVTRVDGESVYYTNAARYRGRWDTLSLFFEGDEYVYIEYRFGLN